MKIIFAGTPDFAVPTLQMLLDSEHEICAVYTQPDRPSGRGRQLTPPPIKTLALQADIEVYQPANFKSDEELALLASFDADLMIVVAYGMILPQTVLDIPRLACLNVHASLLPRWRGAAPIQRAVIAGDKATGVTIMQVVLKLDAGDMLLKETCLIGSQQTASELHDELANLGGIGLAKVLGNYQQITEQAQSQDEALVTYAPKLEKAEAQLDWTQSADELARKIRGLNAWPVAQTVYQDKTLRIWQAQALDAETNEAAGTIINREAKQLDVATGKGVLRLLEVQLPGKKRMRSIDFLNANQLTGIVLG